MLEREARVIRRRGQIRDALLVALVVGGMVAIGAAPRALIPSLGFKQKDDRKYRVHVNTAAHRLVKQGLATWVRKEGVSYLRITPQGERYLEYVQTVYQLKHEKRKWDRRWRIVAFDLPERRRETRARLREAMVNVGFVRLQNSVWVFPYDCEDFIALLKADLKIGKDALYAIVERLENDKALRKHFGLPAG